SAETGPSPACGAIVGSGSGAGAAEATVARATSTSARPPLVQRGRRNLRKRGFGVGRSAIRDRLAAGWLGVALDAIPTAGAVTAAFAAGLLGAGLLGTGLLLARDARFVGAQRLGGRRNEGGRRGRRLGDRRWLGRGRRHRRRRAAAGDGAHDQRGEHADDDR